MHVLKGSEGDGAHVKDLIPVGVESFLDDGGCSGLLASDRCYSKGIRESCVSLSVLVLSLDVGCHSRKTSRLYKPSAAMTSEVRLIGMGRRDATPTCDPQVGFAGHTSQCQTFGHAEGARHTRAGSLQTCCPGGHLAACLAD
jgi:hypothetical protein